MEKEEMLKYEIRKYMCKISLPCFSKGKCHLNPQTDADLLSGLVRSSLIHTQICSPNVQPLIPLILIHSSVCYLFEGYPFCLTFFK